MPPNSGLPGRQLLPESVRSRALRLTSLELQIQHLFVFISNLTLNHIFQDSLELRKTSAITDLKKHPER